MIQVTWEQRKLEIARHDTNHDVRLPIKLDIRAKYVRIAMKSALPERITNHRDMLTIVVLLLCEETAHQRHHPARIPDDPS